MKRLLLLILFFVPIATFAQDLMLDPTFLVGTGFNADPRRIFVQTDGKILVCGNFTNYNGSSNVRLIRLNSNGVKDPTFTTGVGCNNGVEALAVQADGKIIIGGDFTSYNGNSCNRIARLNADGTFDASFNIGSGFNGQVYRLKIQSDGKIIAGGSFSTYNGSSSARIARLNSDGTKDASFLVGTGFSGGISQVSALAIQTDGKIIVGGDFDVYQSTSANNLIRLNSNGTVDATYNISYGTSDGIIDMELQTDGRLVITGRFFQCKGVNRAGVARLNTDGTIDNTFNPGSGMNSGSAAFVCNLKIGLTGKILIGGTFSSFNGQPRNKFCILNTDGSLNTDVSLGTSFNDHVHSIDIQADGRFIIGGFFTSYNGDPINRIARLILYDWSITTGTVALKKCRGDNISVPYTVTGTYNPGNVFSAQLSDATGSFASPVVIGAVSSLTSGTISATIPTTTPQGTGYRIRVVSSLPPIVGSDNGVNIAIYPYPDAYIQGSTTVCDNATSNYATIAEPGVVYQWGVSGGTIIGSSTGSGITVQWSSGSAGSVTLTATYPISGCSVSLNKDVVIVDPPIAVINGDDKGCQGVISTYTTNVSNDYSYEWTVSGGVISGSNSQNTVDIIWGTPGVGSVSVKVSDKTTGCFSTATKNITIYKTPVPTITGPSPACEGDTLVYSANAEAGMAYLWQVAGGFVLGSSTDQTIRIIMGAGPNVAITLTETYTVSGCKAVFTKSVQINKAPNDEIEGNFDICLNSTEKYQVPASVSMNYLWSVTGGTIIGPNNGNSVYVNWPSTPGGKIKLFITNTTTGCKALIEKDVTVNPLPKINAGKDTTICVGSPVTIGDFATAGTGNFTYLWTPGGGLSATDVAKPDASPLVTTQYIVLVTDDKGCTARDTVIVKVNPKIDLTFEGGVVLCQDSLGLLGGLATGGSGALKYSWDPTTGLGTPNSNTTTIKLHDPGFYQYKLIVKDALGCTVQALVGVTIQSNGSLTLKSKELNFGKLDGCTSNKEMELSVTNETQSAIGVNEVTLSNPEFSLVNVAAPFPIGAGETMIIPIKYSPTKTGTSTCDLTFISGTCSAPIKVKLLGEKLQMLLSAKPTTFNLGKKIVCESIAIDTVITITNSGTDVASFDMSLATISAPYSIVSPTGIQSVAPGKTLQITVRFTPTVAGVFNASISLPYTAGTCKDAIKLSFSATITEPKISSDVTAINFGSMLGCDTYKDSTITLTNNGTADAQITSLGGSEFNTQTALPITLKPGESKTITVRYTPQTQGNVTSTISINTTPCAGIIQIPVNVSKQGVSYLIPDTVDCGDLIYCSQKTKETFFTIGNNTPGSECEIYTANLSGEFTTDIAKGNKIISGGQGSYKVTFTPSDATPEGIVYGYIDVLIKPCDVAKKIILKGRKTNVHLAIDTNLLDYGTITVGVEKTKQVKLTNTGTAAVEIQPGDITVKAPFTIVSTIPTLPNIIKPGDSLLVIAKYTAIAGASAEVLDINVIKPCPVDFKVNVKGFGTVLVGKITASIKDFGDVYVDDTKTDSIEVANVGDLDATVSSLSSSNTEFAVKAGQFPISLKIGDKKFIKLDFTPTSVGPKTSNLLVVTDILNQPTTVIGTGIERPIIIMEAEVGLADLHKRTGELFMLPIVLTKSKNLDIKKTTGFEATIKYNKTIMAPTASNTDKSEVKDYQYVTLKGTLKDTIGTIGQFEFRGALGNDSCSVIQIDTIKWIGLDIPTVYVPGSICITDICKTCGDRLVDPTKVLAFNQIKLEQNGESILVDFEVNEKAATQIKLFDLLGECLISREFLPSDFKNNIQKLDLNGIASGIYFITISNEEKRITKSISISK